ncbi:unnamed protein product [Pedinophyceae sp. YPF-701]|nr:unnamed protein product [Pedinophyceae sp. YPF-701]
MAAAARAVGRLTPKTSALFVCDVQERFRATIHQSGALIDASARMVRGCKELSVPVVVTEQYPKALGRTVDELQQVLPAGVEAVPKTLFSMLVPDVENQLQSMKDVNQVMLCGLETHVCILQTAQDLIERGYEVHVLVDAVSSARVQDRDVALRRFASGVHPGCFLTTTESALLQLCGDAKHPNFKAISAMIKEQREAVLGFTSAL